jgi:hypothetical protein
MFLLATGETTSVSTLSVETSRIGSSTAMLSPGCFNHRVTVASATLSPRSGKGTLVSTEPIAVTNYAFFVGV